MFKRRQFLKSAAVAALVPFSGLSLPRLRRRREEKPESVFFVRFGDCRWPHQALAKVEVFRGGRIRAWFRGRRMARIPEKHGWFRFVHQDENAHLYMRLCSNNPKVLSIAEIRFIEFACRAKDCTIGPAEPGEDWEDYQRLYTTVRKEELKAALRRAHEQMNWQPPVPPPRPK